MLLQLQPYKIWAYNLWEFLKMENFACYLTPGWIHHEDFISNIHTFLSYIGKWDIKLRILNIELRILDIKVRKLDIKLCILDNENIHMP